MSDRQHIFVDLGPRTFCGIDGDRLRPITITQDEYRDGLADEPERLCDRCVRAAHDPRRRGLDARLHVPTTHGGTP